MDYYTRLINKHKNQLTTHELVTTTYTSIELKSRFTIPTGDQITKHDIYPLTSKIDDLNSKFTDASNIEPMEYNSTPAPCTITTFKSKLKSKFNIQTITHEPDTTSNTLYEGNLKTKKPHNIQSFDKITSDDQLNKLKSIPLLNNTTELKTEIKCTRNNKKSNNINSMTYKTINLNKNIDALTSQQHRYNLRKIGKRMLIANY
ncbi:unnamed protein product [Adineta steineri]|uniref:Uncharacterized protein n=1 Tax=Adineta steineri TaxID=433720 RepID=A0A813NEG2_9BILA|nr:unnamed protein product [Adineta steineri]CAF0737491.1 unnamed protein product [Adineta steineri]CAF0747231.1 unnamed protein product [Adineta steineri]